MSIITCLVITAIVWSISLISSIKLRALVYSLPIPMTTVLILTPSTVDGVQLVGVVLLSAFFATVSLLHTRWRWQILLADGAAIACYTGVAALTAMVVWPYPWTLAAVLCLWLAATLAFPPSREHVTVATRTMSKTAKLIVVFLSSTLAVALGGLLGGLIVTFPYSGILVAVETRRELPEFTRRFTRNSLGMVLFLVTYHYTTGPQAARLTTSWLVFATTIIALHRIPFPRRIPSQPSGRPYPQAGPAGSSSPVASTLPDRGV